MVPSNSHLDGQLFAVSPLSSVEALGGDPETSSFSSTTPEGTFLLIGVATRLPVSVASLGVCPRGAWSLGAAGFVWRLLCLVIGYPHLREGSEDRA
jgi:hypothetical protein